MAGYTGAPMPHITLARVEDLAALGGRWRSLEQAAQGGFFRSWSFLGCQAEKRFTDPFLLAVTQGGADVALALLNRRRGRFYVGETGDPAQDAVFAEHGGILVRAGAEAVLGAALSAVLAESVVSLPGIDAMQLAVCEAAGLVHLRAQRFAPAVNLAGLDRPYLDTLSANTRSQIRRAQRLYGPEVLLGRAGTLAEAQAWFAAMMALHQQSWQRRGQKGAFADSAIRDFHCALIERAWPRGEVDFLRVEAGGKDIGYLYNFRHGGRVFCYQSGFVQPASPREKPGLVCHVLAIEFYAAAGARVYDMLGGASRYKTSLARDGEMLHWVTLYSKNSILGRIRAVVSRLRG